MSPAAGPKATATLCEKLHQNYRWNNVGEELWSLYIPKSLEEKGSKQEVAFLAGYSRSFRARLQGLQVTAQNDLGRFGGEKSLAGLDGFDGGDEIDRGI